MPGAGGAEVDDLHDLHEIRMKTRGASLPTSSGDAARRARGGGRGRTRSDSGSASVPSERMDHKKGAVGKFFLVERARSLLSWEAPVADFHHSG